jgi:hypothetical protein
VRPVAGRASVILSELLNDYIQGPEVIPDTPSRIWILLFCFRVEAVIWRDDVQSPFAATKPFPSRGRLKRELPAPPPHAIRKGSC